MDRLKMNTLAIIKEAKWIDIMNIHMCNNI